MYIHDSLKRVTPEIKLKEEEVGVQEFKDIYFSLMQSKENIWKLSDPEIIKRFDFFNGTTRTLGYSAAKLETLALLLLRTELPKDVIPQILGNYFTALLSLDMFVERKFLEADCREYYIKQGQEMNKENEQPVTAQVAPERRRKGVKAKFTQLFRK